MNTSSRLLLAFALTGSTAIGLASCTGSQSESQPAAPAERIVDVCLERDGDLTLRDAAFVSSEQERREQLDRLVGQVESRLGKIQALVGEYGESDGLNALELEGQGYADAVKAYRADADPDPFSDLLGDAILAEGAFFSACSTLMTSSQASTQ